MEQGRELSVLKEKIDATQEIGVANCVLDGQMAMGLAGLNGRIKLLEKQGRFLLDQQEQDSNMWHNVMFNLCEEVQEGEEKMTTLQDLLDVQRKLNQQLCLRGSSRDDRCSQGGSSGEEEKTGDEGVGWAEGGVCQAEGDGLLDYCFFEPSEPRDSNQGYPRCFLASDHGVIGR